MNALQQQTRDSMINQADFTESQKDLIKRTCAKGTTDDEFAMFLHYCSKSGLDPLRKQAHCIVNEYYSKRDQKTVRNVQMMTGIDGFRARAEQYDDFNGIKSAAVFADDDFSIDYSKGVVHHIAKFPRTNKSIIGAWAIVSRTGRPDYIHFVEWAELFDSRSPTHTKMPEIMAKKTTEAQAIRHEYPEPFSGIYDPAEIPSSGERILTDGQHNDERTGASNNDKPGRSAKVSEPTASNNNIEDASYSDVEKGDEVRDQGEPLGDTPDVGRAEDSRPPDGSAASRSVSGDEHAASGEPVPADADIPPSSDNNNDPGGAADASGEQVPEDENEDEAASSSPPATQPQVERFTGLMGFAFDNGFLNEETFNLAIEWISNDPAPDQNSVGGKIGMWKARRDRFDSNIDLKNEYEQSIKDVAVSSEDFDNMLQESTAAFDLFVMSGQKKHDYKVFTDRLSEPA